MEKGLVTNEQAQLATLALALDIREDLDEIKNEMANNFVRKETDDEKKMRMEKEKEQEERNRKTDEMWSWHSVLKWLVIVGVPMLMTLVLSVWWGIITNRISITVIP